MQQEIQNRFYITLQFFFPVFVGLIIVSLLTLIISISALTYLFNDNLKQQNRQSLKIVKNMIFQNQNNLRRYLHIFQRNNDFKSAFYYASERLIYKKKPLKDAMQAYKDQLNINWIMAFDTQKKLIVSSLPQNSDIYNLQREKLETIDSLITNAWVDLRIINDIPTLVGIYPLKYFDELLGYLVLGYSMDRTFLEGLKAVTHQDFLIYSAERKLLAATLSKPGSLLEKFNRELSRMNNSTDVRTIESYSLASLKLKNRDHQEVVEFAIISDISLLQQSRQKIIFNFLAIFFCISLLVFIAYFILAKKLTHKINLLFKSLEEYQELLKSQSKLAAIGKTAGILAHDVRTPFTMMLTMLDMFNQYEKDPSLLEEGKTAVRQAVASINSHINDILNFAVQVKLNLQARSLGKVLNFAIRQTLYKFNQLDIQFEYCFQTRFKPLMDEQRMAGVFSNIILNAMEAIQEIGQRQHGRIWIGSSQKHNSIELVIANDGPLIPEDFIKKMFKSFETRGKPSGTGLGLATAEHILKMHGGRIEARNAIERVEFIITLPASKELDTWDISLLPGASRDLLVENRSFNHQQINSKQMEKIEDIQGPIKVLLLEDEGLYRAHVKNLVDQHATLKNQVTIYDACDVDEAEKIMAVHRFDCAIVDIDLGTCKNGFDFINALQQSGDRLPILIHSNRMYNEEEIGRFCELKKENFAAKPLQLNTLLHFLSTINPETTQLN